MTSTEAPRGPAEGREPTTTPPLRIRDLNVRFNDGRGRVVHAVNGVDLDVPAGTTVGVVGESGCGKSTIAKTIVGLVQATSGAVEIFGDDVTGARDGHMDRALRRRCQMVFQDPISSLNPRRRIRDIVAEGPRIHGLAECGANEGDTLEQHVDRMLQSVGIDPAVARDRLPGEFSGGQCQRISIARALAAGPDLLICDEPVSALDVSVQAQVLNILADLRKQLGLTMLFIAHDLAVVKNVSDRVVVMHLGTICEEAGSDALFANPRHPYTVGLMAAIPVPDPDAEQLDVPVLGEVPSPADPPPGCTYHPRCPLATERCRTEVPVLRELAPGHLVACHHPVDRQGEGSVPLADPVVPLATP